MREDRPARRLSYGEAFLLKSKEQGNAPSLTLAVVKDSMHCNIQLEERGWLPSICFAPSSNTTPRILLEDVRETPMCSECGAPDNACEERFNECLAKEFEDPRYGRVHNLTVSAFMLQHSSRLTREGWLYERDLLREFILSGKAPEEIREERQDQLNSGKRAFKIKSETGQPVIPQTAWLKTILGVRLDNPADYCEDVIVWASATLADAESIELD